MGQTTKYHLPYPESVDPANPPQDFRELAEATEFVINAIPVSLPAAQAKTHAALQTITATSGGIVTPGGESVAIKNPHATAKLMVRAQAFGWALITPAQVGYFSLGLKGSTTGITSVFRTGARVESTDASGQMYREYHCEWTCYVNPGVTATFQATANRLVPSASIDGAVKIQTNMQLSVHAISYTLATLPSYPIIVPPAP